MTQAKYAVWLYNQYNAEKSWFAVSNLDDLLKLFNDALLIPYIEKVEACNGHRLVAISDAEFEAIASELSKEKVRKCDYGYKIKFIAYGVWCVASFDSYEIILRDNPKREYYQHITYCHIDTNGRVDQEWDSIDWESRLGGKKKSTMINNKPMQLPNSTKQVKPVQYSFSKYYDCHEGNNPIFSTKGTLFLGGANRGAKPEEVDTIIDLTGRGSLDTEYSSMEFRGSRQVFAESISSIRQDQAYLSLPIPDFGTPHRRFTASFWQKFAEEVFNELNAGYNVLIGCAGGHGRTGLVASIVVYYLAYWTGKDIGNPVDFIRKEYCEEAVETISQEEYVYKMLDLPYEVNKATYTQAYGGTHTHTTNLKCSVCGVKQKDDYDLHDDICWNCWEKLYEDDLEKELNKKESKSTYNQECRWCSGLFSEDDLQQGVCQDCMDAVYNN